MPGIREWVGDRHIQNLSISSYILRNKHFKSTVSVERTKIEDDRFGVFGPIFRKYGRDTTMHPDEMVYLPPRSRNSSPCASCRASAAR